MGEKLPNEKEDKKQDDQSLRIMTIYQSNLYYVPTRSEMLKKEIKATNSTPVDSMPKEDFDLYMFMQKLRER